MVITTAGTHRYGNFITYAVAQAKNLGYKTVVYDLGGLGHGEEWECDEQFVKHGFYVQIGNWKSRALHKPLMIKHCVQKHREFTVYLDADAIVINNIDEIVGDYDIGVTVRKPGEACTDPEYMDYFGCINAGVMFINNTKASMKFCDIWQKKTQELQNDQRALNVIINPDNKVLDDEFVISGVKIKCFPTEIYNYYYFPEQPINAKILHYKDGLWKKMIPKQVHNDINNSVKQRGMHPEIPLNLA